VGECPCCGKGLADPGTLSKPTFDNLKLVRRQIGMRRGQSSAANAKVNDVAYPSPTPSPTAPQLIDATRMPDIIVGEGEMISIEEVQRLQRTGRRQ
jgi:hypothetical protein